MVFPSHRALSARFALNMTPQETNASNQKSIWLPTYQEGAHEGCDHLGCTSQLARMLLEQQQTRRGVCSGCSPARSSLAKSLRAEGGAPCTAGVQSFAAAPKPPQQKRNA
eukprot:5496791-Amphidinium_carterae.2